MTFPPPLDPPVRAPAGWYDDPTGAAKYRFYDGYGWTEHRFTELPKPANDCPIDPPVTSVRWTVLGALVAVLCSTAGAIVAVLATGLVLESGRPIAGPFDLPPLLVLLSAAGLWAGFAVGFACGAHASGHRLRDAFGPTRPTIVAASIAAGMVLQALVVAVSALLGGTDPMTEASEPALAEVVVFALVAVVGAPLFEELYFRGVLLPTLATWIKTTPAVCVQAVVFGAAHFDQGIFGILVTGLVGLALGWLRVRSKSLAAPIALHLGFNAAAFAVLLVS